MGNADWLACKTEEMVIHNWQKTEWADGMMEPVPAPPPPDPGLN